MEMFPLSCALEVNHCLTLMSGDMERAAQLIIHRHESGQNLQPTDRKTVNKNNRKTDKIVDDKSIKERIMGKYGYVDQAEDSRYHRPTIKKEASNFFLWNGLDIFFDIFPEKNCKKKYSGQPFSLAIFVAA